MSTPNKVKVYLHALSGSSTGPYAWCAHIISKGTYEEISGSSTVDHQTRLLIEGSIAVLNRIPARSKVHFVCSDNYLGTWIFARLGDGSEAALAPLRKKANFDLLPSLVEARDRHASVNILTCPQSKMGENQKTVAERAKEIVEEAQEPQDIVTHRPPPTDDASAPW
ncbi:hypothetical protein GGD83_003805 [Rhodoblastus sphagnicola]|nr:hypothetical protein [Rhodoblastus sphagnicola]MBB4199981.1 hypothetical protein [Rhodoblastus sphagnicola]